MRRIQQVKTWQLVILLIMAGFVAATFLRLNNVGMVERRDAVLAADKEVDKDKAAKRLYDLQRYVSNHMNTYPERVPLEKIYEADHAAMVAKMNDGTPSGDIYKLAADVCDPIGQAQGWRWPDPRYTNCISQELEKHPEGGAIIDKFIAIPSVVYYHTFSPPVWSPDFAGWSLVVCGLIALVIIVRLIILAVLKVLLRVKYKKA